MKKNKPFPWWAVLSGGLLLFAAALRFAVRGAGYWPYPLAVAGALIIVFHFRKNWKLLSAGFVAMALLLRFAARGYAWWAYTLVFVAALILLYHYLPVKLWRVLLVLVCLGLAWFCFVELFIIKNARTDREPGRDYLIVLGAAVYKDQPSLTLVRRLEGALDYLEQYPESVAIVSGGMGPGETVTEAQAMHDWLIARGVPEERVLMEPEATSTLENLRFSFEIIRQRGDEPDGNVAIVSSAYHLYRAKAMARNLGVAACGVSAPWGYFFVMLNYFIREAFGVTHLWLLGW